MAYRIRDPDPGNEPGIMHMKKDTFKDKKCWITGASSGIGAALAIALSQQGAFLLLSGRRNNSLQEVKNRCINPERVRIISFDMEQVQFLPELTRQVWNTFDGIDFAFLNAGFAVRDTILNTDYELVQKVMQSNFFGVVALTKTLLPLMIQRGGGRFVITSSLSGKYGIPKLGAYSASKHALHGFFESLRAELHSVGIRVTIIIPGLVRTEISINSLRGDGTISGEMQQSIDGGISPEKCAMQMIGAVARGMNEIVIGGLERHSVWFNRFFPGLFSWVIRNHPLRKIRSFRFPGNRAKNF